MLHSIGLAAMPGSAACDPDMEQATRLLFEGMEEAVLLVKEFRIAYANPAAAALLETEAATLNGRFLKDWLSEEEHSHLYRHLHAAEGGNMKQRGELCRGNGDKLAVNIQCFSTRGDAPGRHMLVLREDRAQALPPLEPALLSLETLPCGALQVDTDLRYLYGNSALARIAPFFSLTRRGSPISLLGWPPAFCAALEETLIQLTAEPHMQRVLLPVDEMRPELSRWAQAIPACDGRGRLQTLSFFFESLHSSEQAAATDIQVCDMNSCDRQPSEKDRYEEAIAASQARDAFFGWVSHELRTPMNGIQSWAHILETYVNASSSSPLAQRALQGIRHGITQQLQLVDELLDISRIIEGRLSLAKQPFNPHPALQEAIESQRDEALARRIHIACHYALARERVSGDPCRVQQMIRLLFNYLLHHAQDGDTIHMHVRCEAGRMAVALHSAGGIVPVDKKPSRGKSRSLKAAKSCRRELDIYLVRRLAELQGGSLEDGIVGKVGSEAESISPTPAFTLLLPLHLPGKKRACTA